MEFGKRYVVTKESDGLTFEAGDHIWLNPDGSINNLEAEGWVEACDVAEATKGMEFEIDQKWIDRERRRMLKKLAELDSSRA